MVAFSNLLAALADVPDPRRAQGKRYPLPYLLLFTVLALLSGARSYRGIITFLEQRREHLNHHFGVDLKRAPVVNTLRTVLQSLPTEALEGAFRRHAKALLPAGEAGEQPVIAIDGKTLRGRFAVIHNVPDQLRRKPYIERHRDRAQDEAGIVAKDDFQAVRQQKRDASPA